MTARILVIEDNPTNLELMTYLLAAHGYDPLTATDGLEGVETAQRERPDLIVCDVQLPKADGYEVVRRLRGHHSLPKTVPLIAVTALAMVGDRERLLRAGFDGYIAKPIEPEKFVKQVEAFLPLEMLAGERKPEIWADAPVDVRQELDSQGIVLVIDDTGANRDLLQSILEPHGFRVVGAASIAEADREILRQRPDLIIADVHLRDGTSLEFIRRLRKDPQFESLPVLVQSANAAELERTAIGKVEGIKLLPRPLPAETLLREIRRVLSVGTKEESRCP